jgi:hypothetical protein
MRERAGSSDACGRRLKARAKRRGEVQGVTMISIGRMQAA